jgi:hypothetical protein
MIHVHEYEETVDYISSSYSYQEKIPFTEFLDNEEVTINLKVSGLTREKARDLRKMLEKMGIAKPSKF